MVCAQFSDGQWYRAHVEGFKGYHQVHIQFTDYGNKNVVNKEALCSFPDALLKYPRLAIRCKLAKGTEGHEYLKSFVLTKKLLLEKVKFKIIEAMFTVDLCLVPSCQKPGGSCVSGVARRRVLDGEFVRLCHWEISCAECGPHVDRV